VGEPNQRGAGVPPAPVDYQLILRRLPTAYVVMDSDLVVVEANDEYLALLDRRREEIVGRWIFEAFPPDPAELDEDGVSELERAYARTRDSGVTEVLPLVRYPIVDPDNGLTVDRWWSLISSAIRDHTGRTKYVMERVEDVTDYVRDRELRLPRDRTVDIEATLYLRLQQVQAAQEARDTSFRRLGRLADVALQLTAADSLEAMVRIVVKEGLTVLGADGGGLTTRSDNGGWRQTVSDHFTTTPLDDLDEVAWDSPLASCFVARTGQRLLLPDEDATVGFHPLMARVVARTGRPAWAVLPLIVGEECLGSLSVAWPRDHLFSQDEIDLLEGFAAQCALTLERIESTEQQRRSARSVARMAETLQRSLLTQPSLHDGVEVAVRYQPAAREAQVGGDWYDCFATRAGGTVLVVGDISGHDQAAAAAMSQVRNLLRGIAYDGADRPAELMSRLDVAMTGLELGALATAVLVMVEPAQPDRPERFIRWVNAGHVPPMVRRTGGRVEVLEAPDDLLLGLDPDVSRHEQSTRLYPGDLLVLYTDGLVERRGEDLDEGIARIGELLGEVDGVGCEVCCDRLLESLEEGDREDDTALLVASVSGVSRTSYDLGDGPELMLSADPRSVREARRFTERRCRHIALDDDLTDTAVLLTSELVTNAVVHGRSEVRLRVLPQERGVRVEVGDDNDRAPVVQPHDEDALSGRGVSLIDDVADAWGVEQAEIGKVVWFTVGAA